VFRSDLLARRRIQEAQVRFGDLPRAAPSTTCRRPATGGSARMLTEGTTISTFSGRARESRAELRFSHASSTSPISRCTNVLVRSARTAVEHRRRAKQLGDEFLGASLRRGDLFRSFRVVPLRQVAVQLAPQLGTPRGEIIPARAAGSLRIRRDDRDARLEQVGPVVNLLRLPLRTRNTIVDVYGALLSGKRVCQLAPRRLPLRWIESMS
jgi:hypothetical protein